MDLIELIMSCGCMHVDLFSQVPGLCQVRVFCVALYRISAELLLSRHLWDLEIERKVPA